MLDHVRLSKSHRVVLKYHHVADDNIKSELCFVPHIFDMECITDKVQVNPEAILKISHILVV